jgi:4-amino-4-deoxy-L-arabinose transferase-like glycosyltransferase
VRRLWDRWALAGVVLTYLALGATYSVVVPVYEAPDESFHFFVIKHIVDHRALPVQRAETRGMWEQEGSQPPLYYVLGALLVGRIDLADVEDLLWRNPQANIGDPMNPGNKNVYVHPPEQDYPWRGAVLAVHILRFFSLALGAATVVTTWAIVDLLAPRRPALAVAVAAMAAFIPQFLFISGTVNNDNAMTFLGTVTLYMLLLRLKVGTRGGDLHRWIGLGVVLGLATLAKLSALALLGLTIVTIALVAWHRRSWRAFWRMGFAVGVPVVAIAGWWYVRNVLLYGEPTGLTAMWEVVGRRDDFGVDLWDEFRGLRYSFWGLYGWFSIPMAGWVYHVLDVFSVLAWVGLLIEVGRWVRLGLGRGAWISLRCREPDWGAAYRPLSLLFTLLWLGAVFASLVRWTSLTEGSQGRLLYSAIAPLAFLTVSGLRTWFLPRVRDAASAILVLAMLALAVATPWAWVRPAYARPAQIAALPEGAVPMELRFGDAIVLRGVGFEQEVVHPGEAFKVHLYWQTARPVAREDEIMVWLRMIDAAGQGVGLEDAYFGSGTFPASLWPVSQLLAGGQYVRVGEDTDAPLVARLNVELYRTGNGERLGAPDRPLPTIGRVKVVPRRWPKAKPGEEIAHFDAGGLPGSVTLAACERREVVRPGEVLPVALTWTVQASPKRDYAVFVHLEDDAGKVYSYGDGAPRGGNYPIWAWAEGEVIVDDRTLAVAADTPPGRYRIVVGLYDGGGRVTAYGADGARLPDDAVDLGMVEVR